MPAYNEAASLPRVVPEVLAALLALSPKVELIVVDDGSRDDTLAVMAELAEQYPNLVTLQLSRNFGKEAALAAGLEAALGDVVVMMDADGQHPAALLPEMLHHWRDGADNVYAVRKNREDQPRLYGFGVRNFYRLLNWGSRFKVPPDAGDFRMLDRRVVQALNALPERNRFMKGLYAWAGFRCVELPYEPLPRQAGRSHYDLRSALKLGITGLLAFTPAPLRLFGVLGLVLALAAMGYGAWTVFEYFYWGIKVQGYATLITSIMFFSGVQLLSIGTLAEYVARIYGEVKRRPLYWVAARRGQGLSSANTNGILVP